ncbi:MAG: alpha-2-macroglobulin, partial [Planctomycetota bacterium]
NNQLLSTAITGADGIARLAVVEDHPDGPPWLVTARLGSDLGYLRPGSRQWAIDAAGLAGRTWPESYEAFLYTERGVYRPGDAIHVTGILRDRAGGVPPSFPLMLHLRRGDGREIATATVTPPEEGQGVFHHAFATLTGARTGQYEVILTLPGSRERLGRVTAIVEEFLPVRLEMECATAADLFHGDDPPEVAIAARYLFGQPAAGLPWRVTTRLEPLTFRSGSHPGFCFTEEKPRRARKIDATGLELDPEGADRLAPELPGDLPPGLWRVTFSATVTEPGSRSVSSRAEARHDSATRHLGLALPQEGDHSLPAGRESVIRWVLLDAEDSLAKLPENDAEIAWELLRVRWESILREVNGRAVWRQEERTERISAGAIEETDAARGAGSIPVLCPKEGFYRLRVTDPLTGIVTLLEFRAGDGNSISHRDDERPERLVLALDREGYRPGERATVTIESPFPGSLLMSLESDRVLATKVVEEADARATIEIDLPPDLRGGAFVAATLVRPIDPGEADWMPHRAFGVARIPIDSSPLRLPVAIEAASEVEPGGTLIISVETDPPADPRRPAVAHLWAVDEGILLASAYRTPDPGPFFHAPRRAVVRGADVYGDLLPDDHAAADLTYIGGDGARARRVRTSPVAARRRQPAVVWRAAMPVDEAGHLVAEIAVPELSGELRLMAVVVSGDRYGSTERPVTVTAPLLVESPWPRFAAPGDTLQVPLKIFNNSRHDLGVVPELFIDGPITAAALPAALVAVPAMATESLWIEVTATGVGPVSVEACVTAASGDVAPLVARCRAELVCRPVAPLYKEAQVVRVEAGERLALAPRKRYLPGSARARVTVSALPAAELAPALEQLIAYPYGCVEQTASRLLALAVAVDEASGFDATGRRGEALRGMIDAGVTRLYSMQNHDGGLSYWPGSGSSSPWGSAHAAEAILEAKRAGAEVPASLEGALLEYLARLLRNRRSEAALGANTRARMLSLLAVAGRPMQGRMALLSEKPDDLDIAARAQLALGWLALGRRDRALSLLGPGLLGLEVPFSASGRITSRVAQDAALLAALLSMEPEHEWVPLLAARVIDARRQGRWGNTLESSRALVALAAYRRFHREPAAFTGRILHGGESTAFDDEKAGKVVVDGADTREIVIESEGAGSLTVVATTEGLLAEPVPPRDHGLVARRRWLDSDGGPLDLAALRVGDLLFVEVTLAVKGAPAGTRHDNIVIVDALPAGLEVENPRLATSISARDHAAAGRRERARTPDTPDRIEFLDDRVLIFTSASVRERRFRYPLRAVTAGSFAVPPLEASSMYLPELSSLTTASRLEVAR